MQLVLMQAPPGLTGSVETPYGNYEIDVNGQVLVDSRVVPALLVGGFTAIPTNIGAVTATYSQEGQPQYWFSEYGDLGIDTTTEEATGVGVDSSGNVYIAGSGGGGTNISFVVKYDKEGNLIWQKTYERGSNNTQIESLTMDADDNVYIAMEDFTANDTYLLKIDPTGSIIWQKSIACDGGGNFSVGNLATDSGKNVLLNMASGGDRYLFKFETDGTAVFQRQLVTAGYGNGMSVDADDNYYTGESPLAKYNSSGVLQWQKSIAGMGFINDSFSDNEGNVYCCSNSADFSDGYNREAIAKVDTNGDFVWLSGVGPGQDFLNPSVTAGVVDSSGNIYSIAFEGITMNVLKMDSSGNLLWQNNFNCSGQLATFYYNAPGEVVLDEANERLLWMGFTNQGTKLYKAFVASIPTDGSALGKFEGFSYTSFPSASVQGTTTTSVTALTEQAGSLVVSAGALVEASATYTAATQEMVPTATFVWQFGQNGTLRFPNGTTATSALSPGDTVLLPQLLTSRIIWGSDAVIIGLNAALPSNRPHSVCIGTNAGATNNNSGGANTVCVGNGAGFNSNTSVCIGFQAGNNGTNGATIAIGPNAGNSNQGFLSIAIGDQAGKTDQGADCVALGFQAGETSQGQYAVALGQQAGQTSQGQYAVAIGLSAGQTNQGPYAVTIGGNAGLTGAGTGSVCIGINAGRNGTGFHAIVIGGDAGWVGSSTVPANSILIDATGNKAALPPAASSLAIAPIRNLATGSNILGYNSTTFEVATTFPQVPQFASDSAANAAVTAASLTLGNGMMYYDNVLNKLKVYTNGTWVAQT